MNTLIMMLGALARQQSAALAPDWTAAIPSEVAPDGLGEVMDILGWKATRNQRPRAQDFPLLAWHDDFGWAYADRRINDDILYVVTAQGPQEIPDDASVMLWQVKVPGVVRHASSGKALSVFWNAIMSRKAMLIDATIATVLVNIIALVTSIYSMQVYDRVIPHNGFSTLTVLTVGMVVALLFDMVIRNTRATMIDRAANDIDSEVAEYFYERMQAVRLDARPKSIGTMAAQLRGTEQVRQLLSSASMFILADLPFALLFIVVMAGLGGIVALVPVIAFPISLPMAAGLARLIRSETNAAQISGNRKNGLLVEALDAAETIKANLGGWAMTAKWNRLMDDVHEHDLKVKRWSTVSGSAFSLIQQLAYVGVVCVGAYEVSQGAMTMGAVIACSILAGRVNGPLVAALPGFIVQWGYSRSSLAALDTILEMPSDRPLDRQLVRHTQAKGVLQIENVRFEHTGTRAGMRIERLHLQPGERVGVIGPVGAGKSTFARLVAGLYAPTEGVVTLDGIDLRQMAEEDLRRHICYLPQDYRLINGTLRDNLVMGLSFQEDAALIEAAQRSGLDELIRSHPSGLDLPISEGGMGLSGGQRALVGLTRLLLAKPKVILVDEPTAALDQDSELRILNALLAEVAPDAVLIFITHKQQLLNVFGRLLVVVNGQLAADGPTQAVLDHLKPKAAPAQAPAASPAPIRVGGSPILTGAALR